jgi:hypothetical protein
MNTPRSVILMGFNELSPSLMLRFKPWIQWPTVHSGLPNREHKIFQMGDGHTLQTECLWDLVGDAGMKSWVCGAMNIHFDTPINGWVLPDPWAVSATPSPETLKHYFKFVQRHAQEYTNDRVPLSAGDCGRFLRFMLTHGLSTRTIASIVTQLRV